MNPLCLIGQHKWILREKALCDLAMLVEDESTVSIEITFECEYCPALKTEFFDRPRRQDNERTP